MNPLRGSLMLILPIVLGFGLLGAGLFMFRYEVWIAAVLALAGVAILALNILWLRRR